MKKLILFFVILFWGLIIAGATTAGMYKWVDKNGVVHFSDFPPKDAASAGVVEIIPTYESDAQPEQQTEKETRKADINIDTVVPDPQEETNSQTPEVELYTTSWCPYCHKARAFFSSRGIPFIEYDVEKDETAARRKRQLTNRKGVPFVVINGNKVYGYNEAAYIRALERNR